MRQLLARQRDITYSDFSDDDLRMFMDDHDISYSIDHEGFIDVLPDHQGVIPSILIRKKNYRVKLEKLRSCGSISFLEAVSVEADNLENVDGYLDCRVAKNVSFDNLQRVDGFLILSRAKQVIANKLEYIKETADLQSARKVELNNLKDSSDIRFNPSLYGKKCGSLFIAPLAGEYGRRALFNENTRMTKFGDTPWIDIDEALEIIEIRLQGKRKNQPHVVEYNKFIQSCLSYN